MSDWLPILLILAMLATLGVLFVGLFAMARGGEFNRKHGNRLMRWRVIMQGTAVLLIGLILLATRD